MVDVGPYVQNHIDNNRSYSEFRVHWPIDDANDDNTCSYVGLNDGEDHAATGPVPTLVIVYTRPVLWRRLRAG